MRGYNAAHKEEARQYRLDHQDERNAKSRNYHHQNREKILARKQSYRDARSEEINRKRKDHYLQNKEQIRERVLIKKYGITLEQFDALLVVQNGRCAICGGREPGGRYGQWYVDHDHITGIVRGLLCNRCNISLGKFEDDPDLLEKAAAYVRAHRP